MNRLNEQHHKDAASNEEVIENSSCQYDIWLNNYRDSLHEMEMTLTKNTGKYSFIYHLYQTGDIDQPIREKYVKPLFDKVKQLKRDCDLDVAELIRCLYVDFEEEKLLLALTSSSGSASTILLETSIENLRLQMKASTVSCKQNQYNYSRMERSFDQKVNVDEFKQEILSQLQGFPFWPSGKQNDKMKNLTFWTESHLLLMLGSAFLYYQYLLVLKPLHDESYYVDNNQRGKRSPTNKQMPIDQNFAKFKELLEIYLTSHFENGDEQSPPYIFEANAHVYLAHSLCALFNLYDFSLDEKIRKMSEQMIDRMVYQIMLCTDSLKGVANLSASTRSASRLLQRNHNHTINQLIKVMNNGNCIDSYEPTYISCYLLTTSWLPKDKAFNALHGMGTITHNERFSPPSLADIRTNFDQQELENHMEIAPFYWSTGGIIHENVFELTNRFIAKYNLSDHKELHMLLSPFLKLVKNSDLAKHFSVGQLYLDVQMTVYKLPGLVLSSLNRYNCHYAGFQQIPWCANVGGFPVYARTGPGMNVNKVCGFSMENSHMPAVQQLGSILLATYVTPSSFIFKQSFDTSLQLVWPFRPFRHIHGLRYQQSEQLQSDTLNDLKIMNQGNRSQGVLEESKYFWIIGSCAGSYIGCLFTKDPELYAGNKEHDTFTVMKSEGKLDELFCSLVKVCSQEVVSLVVVVGTKMQYNSLTNFAEDRLNHIQVTETIDNRKNSSKGKSHRIYNVVVQDNSDSENTLLQYTCDLNNPHARYENAEKQETKDPVVRDFIAGDKIAEVIRFADDAFPYRRHIELLEETQLIELPAKWIDLEPTELGQGGFGVAKKGILRLSDSPLSETVPVAVKFPIRKESLFNVSTSAEASTTIAIAAERAINRVAAAFVNEMSLVKQFAQVPYVVQCYGYVFNPDHGDGLVLELAPYGSLSDVMRLSCYREFIIESKNQKFLLQWLKEICNALNQLHRLQIVHQDLKPGNVLLFGGLNIKLSDFGTSRHIEDEKSSGGTFVYQAPELRMLGSGKPVLSSDIFSLAMTTIALFKGSTPDFGYQEEMQRYIVHSNEKVQSRLINLLKECLNYDLSRSGSDYGRPIATTAYAILNELSKSDPCSPEEIDLFECLLCSSL